MFRGDTLWRVKIGNHHAGNEDTFQKLLSQSRLSSQFRPEEKERPIGFQNIPSEKEVDFIVATAVNVFRRLKLPRILLLPFISACISLYLSGSVAAAETIQPERSSEQNESEKTSKKSNQAQTQASKSTQDKFGRKHKPVAQQFDKEVSPDVTRHGKEVKEKQPPETASTYRDVQEKLFVLRPNKNSIAKHKKTPEPSASTAVSVAINFAYDPADYKFTKYSEAEYTEQYKQFKERLERKILPFVASSEVLRKIAESKGFMVVIRPSSFVDGGKYYKNRNQIFIEMDPTWSDEMLVNIFRNEYFHASSCVLSRNIAKDPDSCLDSNDNVQLRLEIDKGYAKVRYYQKIIKEYEANAGQALSPELQQLINAAENYLPYNFRYKMSLEEHSEFLKDKSLTLLANGLVLVPGGSYSFNDIDRISDAYGSFAKLDENTILWEFSSYDGGQSVLSKAKAFVNDVISRHAHFYQRGADSVYSKQSEQTQTENLASDIAQLPEALKKLVYDGYCALMTAVTNVEDYCRTPSFRP